MTKRTFLPVGTWARMGLFLLALSGIRCDPGGEPLASSRALVRYLNTNVALTDVDYTFTPRPNTLNQGPSLSTRIKNTGDVDVPRAVERTTFYLNVDLLDQGGRILSVCRAQVPSILHGQTIWIITQCQRSTNAPTSYDPANLEAIKSWKHTFSSHTSSSGSGCYYAVTSHVDEELDPL